jgi:hypothetical protein
MHRWYSAALQELKSIIHTVLERSTKQQTINKHERQRPELVDPSFHMLQVLNYGSVSA